MRLVDVKFPINQPFGGMKTAGVAPSWTPDTVGWYDRLYGNYQPYGHAGCDIACPEGTPVQAIAAGTVLWADWGTKLWFSDGGVVNNTPISNAVDAGATATDSFTYTLRDAGGLTSTATVTVTVTGIDAGCAGKTVSVTLTGAAGVNLGTISGVAAGTSLALTPAAHLDAKSVTGVSVAING